MATPITTTQQTQILQLVVGVFGAAPGADYMNQFADIVTSGASIENLAVALMNTSAAKDAAFYPTFLTSSAFATKFVDNLVGSTVTADQKADAADYITSQLNAGHTRGEMVWWAVNALANVSATDANWGTAHTQLVNKVDVSFYYTITTGNSAADVATLQSVLSSVTADPATVTAAEAAIDGGTIGGGTGGSLTIALTTSTESFTGGTAADVFNAAIGTLQNGDSLNGAAGVDVLNIRDAGGGGIATVRNIEEINFIALGTSLLDLTDAAGYTSLNVWGAGGSATIQNINSGANLIIGVMSGFGGDLTIGNQDEASTADVLSLNVNNASAFGLMESAHSYETINIAAAGSGVAITATVDSSTTTIAVTGTASVTLELERDAGNAAMAVNATALAGNLTLTIHSSLGADVVSAQAFAINAGSGDDVINLAPAFSSMAVLDSAARIDGGAGTDTLRVGTEKVGQTLFTALGFENLQIVADFATAGMNLASAQSFNDISIWGAAAQDTAFQLVGMTAGVTVSVKSGFAGDLTVGLASETGTANSITLVAANNTGAFEFHETARSIETINLQVTGTGYAASASEFGTATTNFNILGDQNVTMRLNVNSANTAVTISATALTAGNLSLTIDALSGNVQFVATLGTGSDTLTLGSGFYHNNMTATVDGGLGTDTLKLVIDTAGPLAPNIANFETVSLRFGESGGNVDASGVTGMTTLTVLLASSQESAGNITKLNSEVTTLNLNVVTSNSGATATTNFTFLTNPAAVTLNINGSNATAATAHMGRVSVSSATTLAIVANGSNNIQMNEIWADQATSLTITMGASGVDLNLSAVSAQNAGSVTINATAGDINIGSATFATATLVTINQAGGTGSYSGSYIGLLNAIKSDLTINVAGLGGSATTAGVIISTAAIRDDFSITTNGGDVIITELEMAGSAASSLSGLRGTIVANGSADYVIINSLHINSGGGASAQTAGTLALTLTISGSGDVTIAAIVSTGATGGGGGAISAATANTINASGLFGTFILGASANLGTGGNYNFTVNLGADQASANNIALGAGKDTINGGGNKDTIEAGAGQDTMFGGNGGDLFVFLSSAGDVVADQTTGQKDFVMDFNTASDTIFFSGITQLTSLAGWTSLSGLSGTPSAISTATLVGQNLSTANGIAIYQASGNTYIEVGLLSGVVGADFSSVVVIVLDGLNGWTSLSSVFNISVGGSGLYIQHV